MKTFLLTVLSSLAFSISVLGQTSLSEQFTEYDVAASWSPVGAPGNVGPGENVSIDGTTYRPSGLTVFGVFGGAGTLTILEEDTLVIDGDLDILSGGDIIIEENAVLVVLGDFTSFILPTVENSGTLLVDGDVFLDNISGSAQNNGVIEASGNITAAGGIDGNGTEQAGGFSSGNQDFIDALNADPIQSLPIELKSFEGILTQNKTTKLKWITAKEENFSHFEIQRSINNQDFEVIGTVNGLGESNSDVYYSFNDKNVPYGIVRYRLNAVDIDESFELFEAIEIQNTFSSELKAFPNPVTDFSKLRIVVPQDLSGKLNKVALYDNAGSLLYSQTDYDPIVGKIEIENIKEGLYILKITHNGLTENLRILKN